jgi:probable HAF family extracellular repeat protein
VLILLHFAGRNFRMPSLHYRALPPCALLIALASWGCSPDDQSPTAPNGASELSTAAAANYRVRDLGTLGGQFSRAYDINSAGVVVGASSLTASDFRTHAFVWKSGVMKDLGTLVGAHESQANAINVDGVIVGWSRNSAGDMRAVRWGADGKKRSLGTLGGRNSEARDINDFGVIVGWSETVTGQRHAFRWENGVMKDIGTLGGHSSVANGINRGGAIVGQSTTASGEGRAFKWKSGVFKNLGAQVGALKLQFSVATAINTTGQIVGVLGPTEDAEGEEQDFTDGFLFYQEVMKLCCAGSLYHPTTHVEDISSAGIIVGWDEDVRGESTDPSENAWVQESGTTALLPELAVGHTGAEGINSRGDIVGYSQNSAGRTHAVIWKRQ